ncbi:MAG TPA: response regulator [Gemmataceae bacterium]|nr:response regulator [Gemmataceae bacterium]
MLVLSRKLNEKIVLPTLNTVVEVLGIKRGTVRLGISAPPDVTVLREELPDRTTEWDRSETYPPALEDVQEGSQAEHSMEQVRDRLQTAARGLGLLHLQLDVGQIDEARATLAAIQDDLQLLRFGLDAVPEPAAKCLAKERRAPKALLVEDDRNERELLAGFLRQAGVDVTTAGDGQDALEYLHSQSAPDFVLLDMGLPHVDGPTMVREIRNDPAYAGLKIFGVTGHQPEEFDLECGPGGIDRWFQKPVDVNLLLRDLAAVPGQPLCGI